MNILMSSNRWTFHFSVQGIILLGIRSIKSEFLGRSRPNRSSFLRNMGYEENEDCSLVGLAVNISACFSVSGKMINRTMVDWYREVRFAFEWNDYFCCYPLRRLRTYWELAQTTSFCLNQHSKLVRKYFYYDKGRSEKSAGRFGFLPFPAEVSML